MHDAWAPKQKPYPAYNIPFPRSRASAMIAAMKSRFNFDDGEHRSKQEISGVAALFRKGDIIELGGRFYEIEHCAYAPERNEATYWLAPGWDQHPTAPDA